MTRLPHELLVLGLPAENRERALHAVLTHVAGLTDVRVVGALVVVMSSGEVSETREILGAATPGVIGQEDIAEIGSVLAPDGSAVAVLVEHVWATRLAAGLQTVNGRLRRGVREREADRGAAAPLVRLAQLRERDLITEREFRRARQRILGR